MNGENITVIMDDFYRAVKDASVEDAYAALMRRTGLVSDREAIESLVRLCVGLEARLRFQGRVRKDPEEMESAHV